MGGAIKQLQGAIQETAPTTDHRANLFTSPRLSSTEPTGPKMRGTHFTAALVLLILVQNSWQIPVQETEDSRLWSEEDSRELSAAKRHSQGTFTNDYSKYLETQRAQDFVQWLMNSKRGGEVARRHAEGTYTSDVSSYLQDQAAKEFVSWLKMGRGRRQ
ncbi:hypothetical protein GN956_G24058 [Arapaima gigas]